MDDLDFVAPAEFDPSAPVFRFLPEHMPVLEELADLLAPVAPGLTNAIMGLRRGNVDFGPEYLFRRALSYESDEIQAGIPVLQAFVDTHEGEPKKLAEFALGILRTIDKLRWQAYNS